MAIRAGSYFEITGIAELDKKLAGMEKKLQDKYLRKATRVAAKAVLVHARRLVPEDSGALAASLKVRSAAMTTTTKGGKKKRSTKYRGLVGHGVIAGDGLFKGDQFYAGFLEFGTKQRKTKAALWKDPRNTGGGANRGRLDEQKFAFLRPALYAEESTTRQIFRVEVARFVTEAGKTQRLTQTEGGR